MTLLSCDPVVVLAWLYFVKIILFVYPCLCAISFVFFSVLFLPPHSDMHVVRSDGPGLETTARWVCPWLLVSAAGDNNVNVSVVVSCSEHTER